MKKHEKNKILAEKLKNGEIKRGETNNEKDSKLSDS